MNDNTISTVGDMLRANPLGAAMIGAGLFWMFAGARTSEAVLGAARAVSDADLPLSPTRIAETATGMASTVADAAQRSASAMRDNASSLMQAEPARNALEAMETMRRSMTGMFAAQPLMIAATGLAVGAAIAASLPATDMETRTLGGVAGDLKQQASDFVSRGAEEEKSAMSGIASSAQEAAGRQGLTGDTVAGKFHDAAREAGNDAGLI